MSAAEPSADRHGAVLIEALRSLLPGIHVVGVAGPRMAAAGCACVFDMTSHAGMLLGAVRQAGRAARMLALAGDRLRSEPFDACVVIDSPVLHIPLVHRANAAGVPTLYYIAPQMWAWGRYRVHKLRDRVDKIAAILPFEEEFFRDYGLDATFVGHPLAEQLREEAVNTESVEAIRGTGEPVVALLPGSRSHVIEEVFPGQLEVAAGVAASLPGAGFGVSVANDKAAAIIEREIRRAGLTNRVHSLPGAHRELIEAADLALVASGTTTLEVAFCGKPMVVMYNASRWFYHLVGRWMVQLDHYALPNILAGAEIVPEFMPYYRSTAPITRVALDLLQDQQKRAAMSAALLDVTMPLRDGCASHNTARLLRDLIVAHRH
jgi:lipid-A-disaccharide synthase